MYQALVNTAWSRYTSFARSHILSVLESGVEDGVLIVVDATGRSVFGTPKKGREPIVLVVTDDRFWTRILTGGDVGFSEAFMLDYFKVNHLKGLLTLYLENRERLAGLDTLAYKITTTISAIGITLFGQTHTQARLNAIASYDVSNALFQAFLSDEMMYSCALWGEEEGGVRGDLDHGPTPGDLESAQKRKIHHVLQKARVRPGDRVLEFGSGWGGLAIEAARSFGCTVDSLTLSKEQKALAEERIEAAGLSDKITIHLMDYRDLPPHFEKAFDAFVSVEMLEHVGCKYYEKYFQLVDWALKSDRATAVCTSSTQPEARYTPYQYNDYCRRYIWPNGHIPSASTLIQAANTGSKGQLNLEGVEDHGLHYARTQREWARRLDANFEKVAVPELLETYPELREGNALEVFKRKWMYLYSYAEAGFAKAYISCHMLTFVRTDNASVICD